MSVRINIKAPIWNGGDNRRKVGIAAHRMTSGILEVKIGYKEETSELYPDPFYICKERAEKYPVQFVKGVKLYLIPLDQMFTSIVEARDDRDRYFEELNV